MAECFFTTFLHGHALSKGAYRHIKIVLRTCEVSQRRNLSDISAYGSK